MRGGHLCLKSEEAACREQLLSGPRCRSPALSWPRPLIRGLSFPPLRTGFPGTKENHEQKTVEENKKEDALHLHF